MSKVAIIGGRQSGKTTIFKILANTISDSNTIADIKLNDNRLKNLSDIFKPKRTIYATFTLLDSKEDKGHSVFSLDLQELQKCELLLCIIRLFEDDSVYYPFGDEINPIIEYNELKSELLLKDIELLDKREERIKSGLKSAKKSEREKKEAELNLVVRLRDFLEEGKGLENIEFNDMELRYITSYNLINFKKKIYILNINDSTNNDKKDAIIEELKRNREHFLIFDGKLELEISELSEDDREEFKKDMGLEYFSSELIKREAFSLLDYITFFTVGEDECRAWPIKRGMTAKKAAGKIHSDLERGFIRAEVIAYDKFMQYKDWNKVKKSKDFRLEGADYIVKDGDIMHIRFNV